ncbi:MAG: hypothetical protein QOF49_1625 [Chloroflexota bacterium]|jgi:uncharacterized protein|nr:hypothetical protein [Chloroflexota bacterium]
MTAAHKGEPLTYPLSGLLREAPGSTRLYPVAGVTIDLGPDLRLADPIEGTIRVSRTNRGVIVNGRLETALLSQCSRCLKDIEVPLELEIEEEALPSIDVQTGLPMDWSTEPDAIRLNGAHELELEPVVREAIQLAEPIAPLCREDCPGLCVVCGAELEAGPHQHEEDIDPRLEALRAFMVDGNGGTH